MPVMANAKVQLIRLIEALLHSSVKMAGQVVFAEDLTYIPMLDDQAWDHSAKLFKTRRHKDAASRTGVALPETPTSPKIALGLNTDAMTTIELVSDAELKELRELIEGWVHMRKAVAKAEVVKLDDTDDAQPDGGSTAVAAQCGALADGGGAGAPPCEDARGGGGGVARLSGGATTATTDDAGRGSSEDGVARPCSAAAAAAATDERRAACADCSVAFGSVRGPLESGAAAAAATSAEQGAGGGRSGGVRG